ncbi:spondin-1-like isoform X2 [Galleria mellonella]|uniref:Spondin-1-like isoform X2 n=1 Tax=Galleria mellonella TaxID=7137 RepID=A0A6J3BQQ5_GALME|nr:spondin-1-like isoform X2 [Galleria mellonella]
MNSMEHLVILCILFITYDEISSFRCDRRPYGATSPSSAPDGRFKLKLLGTDFSYIPEQLYTVQITATDEESQFTGFMISAEGDTKPDPRNPRRTISQFPGDIRPQDPSTARFSDRCLYSVEQATSSYKSSIEVYWQAPPTGNGCVTLRAMVAENEDLWFEDGSPLTMRICEDLRQPDDVSPQLNYECQICDEAKYEISFTGIWSRNTHPQLYPENDWVPRYSDMVGVSHSTDFVLWTPGSLVTEGMKDLAEHANTSKLEAEILEKVGDGVRTLIKAKGHGYRKMNNPALAIFRTDKIHHLVTVAIGLFPSPDWFLGVTRFELCQEDNTWLPERELNLFPWDAGTDSGVSYESPNIETFPQGAVSRVQMSSYDKNSPFYEIDMKDLHPFGRLYIKLMRTYHRECEEISEEEGEKESPSTEENPTEEEVKTNPVEPDEPSSESPIETDPESSEKCPISQWQEWSPCEGACEGGKVSGYKWRERYHLVDGVAVEKYDPSNWRSPKKEVSKFCKALFDDFERSECEEDCTGDNVDEENGNDITAGRRVMPPIIPGTSWRSNKRDTPKSKH